MSYTDFDFPHTSLYQSDLREILAQMKKLEGIVQTFVTTEQVKFADPIIWNITSQYAKTTIVLDTSGNAYLSKQAVPSGIQLNNENYWQEIFNFTDYTRTANKNLTVHVETNTTRATENYSENDWLIWNDVLYLVTTDIAIDDTLIIGNNILHFTVEDFIKNFMTWATNTIQQYKNDIDASEVAYREELAQDIATTTASLQAQLDEAIAGVTVDSEVINARIGFNGMTFTTLGDAIRTQIGDIVSNLLTLHDRKININPLAGYYIHQLNGIVSTVNTWSVSELIYCHDWKCINLDNAGANIGNVYNGWFDEDGTFISSFRIGASGYRSIDVPSNAYYVAFSEETTKLVQWEVSYVTKLDVENNFDDFTSKMNDKYRNLGHDFILTTPISMYEFGSLDPTYSGNQYYRYRSSMLCTNDEMFKHNNYTLEFNNSDYAVRVYYYKDKDDVIADFTYRSGWINNGTEKVEFSTNSRYIRLEFAWHNSDAYMYTPDLIKCVNSTVIYNITDKTNKYMRVCTFNMARDWSSFRDHEFTDWQIAEYKKLFGEINADIVCMQEAYGAIVDGVREPGYYVDMDHTKHMFNDVMASKYNETDNYRGSDHRTIIKYRFTSTYDDYIDINISTRTYQRMLIPLDNGLLAVYNTHLNYVGDYSDLQGPEMAALINIIAADKITFGFKWVVICGDFNVWDPDNYNIFVTNGYKLGNCGDFGVIPTWAELDYYDPNDNNKYWNMSPCDNVIVSSNIDIQNVKAVPIYEPFDPDDYPRQYPVWYQGAPHALSDHYPFYADLLLND